MIPALRPVATPPPGCYPSSRRPDLGFDASSTGKVQSSQSLKIGRDLAPYMQRRACRSYGT